MPCESLSRSPLYQHRHEHNFHFPFSSPSLINITFFCNHPVSHTLVAGRLALSALYHCSRSIRHVSFVSFNLIAFIAVKMDEGEKVKVLFLTNSELGQSSVCLAVTHEFLLRPEYEVHIASFPVLGPTVTKVNARAKSLASAQQEATFHPLCGLSMKDAYIQKVGNQRTFNNHRVGLRGAMNAYKSVLINALAPWNGSEYMAVYFQCFSVIQDIQPVVVVVDPLFAPAIDACLKLKLPYLVLSPNTLKDHCQPRLANFWKFPA